MTKRGKGILLAASVLIFLLGLSCALYPLISSQYNARHKAEVRTRYDTALEAAGSDTLRAAWAAAEAYNDKLYRGGLSPLTPEANGYYDLLDITGTGIMGHLRIPAIGICLPVYHGVSDKALSTGAGHMPQTSLPIGGENTHAALSSHTGMASDALFSDLERLDIGDRFYLDVLGQTLTYQVDDIRVVLPHEVDSLKIREGGDYVTLITCTPYGINTHRLLVRGVRVPDAPDAPGQPGNGDAPKGTGSVYTSQYLKGILRGGIAGGGLLAVLAAAAAIRNKKARSGGSGRKEEQN